jgi:hypothetical protein
MLFLLPLIWMGQGLGLRLLRAQGLSLDPGQYSNQRFQDPIHLSRGNYTFKSCTFEVAPGNAGIVAESEGLLIIDRCWFYGSGTGSGVVSEKTMMVKHSDFKQLSIGLYYCNASGPADTDNNPSNDDDIKMNVFEGLDVGIRKDGEGKISIVGNTFLNNKRAIELGYSPAGPLTVMGEATANISLNFKCNGFFITDYCLLQ